MSPELKEYLITQLKSRISFLNFDLKAFKGHRYESVTNTEKKKAIDGFKNSWNERKKLNKYLKELKKL